jgi:N-carbamoylputrescine amidase
MTEKSRVRRIALAQLRLEQEAAVNSEQAATAVRNAAEQGAEIVCLPELFRTRYFPQEEDADRFDLAEPIPGPTTERFSKLARELELVVIAPIFERRARGLYHNSAVVLDADGSLVGLYRKMHIPDDPGFFEKFYFAPGDLGFRAFDTRAGRIGVLICWDQWFPEAARLVALGGAELLFFPSAIGWVEAEDEEERNAARDSWVTIQRAHAIASGIYVAAVNRVGREGSLEFYGSSFVADPQGRILVQAGEDEQTVVVADCPLSRIEEQRRGWPFLRDRRLDAYGDLLVRYRR